MKRLAALHRSVSRNASSIPALLLLGAISGTALAATDIQAPCPHADDLQSFITDNDLTPLVRTVEASEDAHAATVADAEAVGKETENAVETDESSVSASAPAFTTRLPGVSANDMPRFRRHMYRTDI